jgi:hypothetical protein
MISLLHDIMVYDIIAKIICDIIVLLTLLCFNDIIYDNRYDGREQDCVVVLALYPNDPNPVE